MIDYEPGYWGVCFAVRIKGSVLPKALVWAVPISLLAVAFHVWLKGDADEQEIKSRQSDLDGSMSAVSMVLGFLIVFRTQKAYDRWWEAAKLLQQVRGCWFNSFSNLIAFGNQAPENREKLDALRHQLARLFSLLYGNALMQCSTSEDNVLEFIDISGFDQSSLEYLAHAHDPCEVVLQWIQRTIVVATDDNVIKIAPPILSRVYNQLGNGIVSLSGARQIKRFPIPFLLAQMLIVLLLFHSTIAPLFFAMKLESSGMVFVASFVCEICFWGIHYIAEELEGPYGREANDLPLMELQEDLNKSLIAMMHPKARLAPSFNYRAEADQYCPTVTMDLKPYLLRQSEVLPVLTNVGLSGTAGAGAGDPRACGASQHDMSDLHVSVDGDRMHGAEAEAPLKAHGQLSRVRGRLAESNDPQMRGSSLESLDAPDRQTRAGGKAGGKHRAPPSSRSGSAEKYAAPAPVDGGGEPRGEPRGAERGRVQKLQDKRGTEITLFSERLHSRNSDHPVAAAGAAQGRGCLIQSFAL